MAETPRRRRKLAAILMLDVVGFSRMMGRDEEATTSAILDFHDTVRSVVEGHGGRVVSTAGDSVFGDFDSIVEALSAAEDIQRALHAENVGKTQAERIEARIGLHLGDVIVEERNVFGDGVNVAARLEQLAEPGGIMLSEAAYHLVRGRTELPIELVGMHDLKNITEPIEVYRIRPEAFGGAITPEVLPGRRTTEPGSDHGDRIRAAIARIAEQVADQVEDGDGPALSGAVIRREVKRRVVGDRPVVRVFGAGKAALVAFGVLGIVAWTSGWTTNAWYPLFGCYLAGIGLGGTLDTISGRPGLRKMLGSIGIGIGAMFHDSAAIRAVCIVIAVVGAVTALQRLADGDRRRT